MIVSILARILDTKEEEEQKTFGWPASYDDLEDADFPAPPPPLPN